LVQGSILLLVLEEELAGPGDVEAALGPGPTHPLFPLYLAHLFRLLQRLLSVRMIITAIYLFIKYWLLTHKQLNFNAVWYWKMEKRGKVFVSVADPDPVPFWPLDPG
jgi:hypothetical protein